MPDVTLVVTSCNRHDLLERTLRSFAQFNTYPVKATVIVEDGELDAPRWLDQISGLGQKTWITNGVRKGQVYSADRAWEEVETPYCFWCEDDWEFYRSGFIEKSLEILDKYQNIVQCSLREDWEHPSVTLPEFPFPVNQPDWQEGWSGFSFNPGLRRVKDYERISSYGRHVGYDPSFVGELHLSKLYREMGFYAAALPAHCRHIGEGNRHVSWSTAPKVPKVLIAIPACHKYDYGEFQDQRIGHVDRNSNERISAIRDTWAKDLEAFRSYVDLNFFYGTHPGEGVASWRSDEVFLPVADGYEFLPAKVQAIFAWALEHNYDYVFKADDDTFIYLDRLLASGFEHYEYLGYCYPSHGNYISGGPGYWVSKPSMRHLVDGKVDGWAEDKWVGAVLKSKGIRPARDARYLPGFDRHYVDLSQLPERHNYISLHACTPQMMKQLHDAHPRPTFRLQGSALGEGHYPNADKFELNVRRLERINGEPVDAWATNGQPAPAKALGDTDGSRSDPRRRPPVIRDLTPRISSFSRS